MRLIHGFENISFNYDLKKEKRMKDIYLLSSNEKKIK